VLTCTPCLSSPGLPFAPEIRRKRALFHDHTPFKFLHKNTAEWLRQLQAHGYRVTAPGKAVVETIAASQHALTPLEVYEQTRRHYPAGLVTVYRTIEKLEELSLCSACTARTAARHSSLPLQATSTC